jgi:branched-subunit amino acid ABC-type transport system permease component
MGQYIAYVLLGLGAGAVYSSLGISLVLTHRTSNVLNFATGAMAMYAAYVFVYLRQSGEYVIPIPGVPAVHLGDSVAFAPAVLLTMLTSAVLGVVVYVLVFGPLRYALPLTKVVASVALMLVLQASVGLRLGTQPVFGPDIFPKSSVTLSGVSIPLDRFYLAASVVAMAIVLWLGLRFTRAGLVSRAVADSERGSWVVGISPQRVACGNWALASVVAGLGGVLVSPLFPLIPGNYTLFAAPAFAAALAGRLSRLGPCVLAGFLIGSTQSVFSLLQGKPWWPSFLSSGLGDALPLLVIILILVFAGAPMPQRGFVTQPRLPVAHKLGSPVRTVVIATVLGVLALIFTSGGYRVGVITTFVMATLALSLVVVTGFVGQISLGNLAVAGVGAYLVAKFETDWGVPFPFSMLLAVMGATVIGMLVGLPALRVRGVQLAVVTMSAAVAIPAVYFNNPPLADAGPFGTEVNGPRLGGINLGIFGGGYPRLAFGFVALGLLVAAGSAVVWLRRGTWGGYLLAVRANERAAR